MNAFLFQIKVTVLDSESLSPTGTIGEVFFKPIGGSEFLGYYKNKEETEAKFKDGWVSTG